MTGKHAEPEHFGQCAFTGSEVLNTGLALSEVSGHRYRSDQQLRSGVSGKAGHKDEFIYCHETRHPIVPTEAERCAVTGHLVRPGVLENCAASGKAVLPAELARCSVSGQRVSKKPARHEQHIRRATASAGGREVRRRPILRPRRSEDLHVERASGASG